MRRWRARERLALASDEPALDEAQRLAESLAQGAQLQPLHVDGLPLVHVEHAYAEVDVEAWRLLAAGLVYEGGSTLVGGPVLMAVSALASATGNRRRRPAVQRASAPQWRPLNSREYGLATAPTEPKHHRRPADKDGDPALAD